MIVQRLRDELSAPGGPVPIDGVDVLDANVQEAGDVIWILGRLDRHLGLVGGGPAARVDHDPSVVEAKHRRRVVAYDFGAEDVAIEADRTLHVGHDQHLREHDSLLLGGLAEWAAVG